MSAGARAAAGVALAAWAVLVSGCTCTGFGHSVDDEFGCTTDADCPAGRACLPDPGSGELFCVVSALPDGGADGGNDSGTDAGSDGGSDSGTDSGNDSGTDSGSDAGTDSGTDSGPACPLGDPCDDGNLCTIGETCDASGVCGGGAPVDCSAFDGQCTAGVCSGATGACTAAPINEGGACDDGAFCFTGETCTAGACTGAPRDCSGSGDQCNAGTCSEATDTCVASPLPGGTPCEDGAFCTIGEACAGGSCLGGTARSCSDGNQCTSDGCDETGDTCQNPALPGGTPCDDAAFCTTGETCAAGACGSGAPRACGDVLFCTADSCDELGDACVNDPLPLDGDACDDGLFCTVGEICGAGACGGGGSNPCDDTNACTLDSCNESGDLCGHDPAPLNGMSCSDGLFCTNPDVCTAGSCGGAARTCADGLFCNGLETCSEALDVCAPGTPPCASDLYSCTVTCVEATDVCNVRDEALCAAMQICNPVAYGGVVTGCGPVPVTFTTTCPATGPPGAAVGCTLALATAVGIDGEAARIACTATPMPATMFADDFDDGALDAPWVTVIGSPGTDPTPGTPAAVADLETWEADVVLSVAGLSVVCVDFDVAQETADAAERIRWDVRFDAGLFSTAFDLDFVSWEVGNVTHAYNRNVCVAVPVAASTVTWRLRMSAGMDRVWVDDVVMSGIAAAYTIPANGGPDDMATEAGWTFAGGGAPYVGLNGGSSAMFANVETFTATRGAIDATSCDVLDVDFDFGFLGATDTADDIRLEVSVDGGAFTTVELLDLAPGAWNVDDTLLPWFGLRRVTGTVPSAAGAASVVFRFTLRSDDGGDRVWVDDFVVRCADLAVPAVGAVVDAGGGAYTVSVTSAVPEDVQLECVWATTNDGPLVSSDVVTIY